jgi:hypothetical protein
MRRAADTLLIGAWRVWSRLSFVLALLVVLVALPFVGPVVYLLHWLGWFDRD